jgi:hypothetical protein
VDKSGLGSYSEVAFAIFGVEPLGSSIRDLCNLLHEDGDCGAEKIITFDTNDLFGRECQHLGNGFCKNGWIRVN